MGFPVPGIVFSKPAIKFSKPGTEISKPGIENPKPGIENPKPGTEISKPGTGNPKPGTGNARRTPARRRRGTQKIPAAARECGTTTGNIKKEVGRTISRVLYGAAPRERAPRACHLSARSVAATLYRSTLQRARAATHLRGAGWTPHSGGPPSDVGLHELSASDVHSAHVAVRLVSSYLTFSPLPCPRARMAERNRRFFSSARVHPCGRLPIKKQIALCCPDFPHVPFRHRRQAVRPTSGCKISGILKKRRAGMPYFSPLLSFFYPRRPRAAHSLAIRFTYWE